MLALLLAATPAAERRRVGRRAERLRIRRITGLARASVWLVLLLPLIAILVAWFRLPPTNALKATFALLGAVSWLYIGYQFVVGSEQWDVIGRLFIRRVDPRMAQRLLERRPSTFTFCLAHRRWRWTILVVVLLWCMVATVDQFWGNFGPPDCASPLIFFGAVGVLIIIDRRCKATWAGWRDWSFTRCLLCGHPLRHARCTECGAYYTGLARAGIPSGH